MTGADDGIGEQALYDVAYETNRRAAIGFPTDGLVDRLGPLAAG